MPTAKRKTRSKRDPAVAPKIPKNETTVTVDRSEEVLDPPSIKVRTLRVLPGRALLWPDNSFRGDGDSDYAVRSDDPFIKDFMHNLVEVKDGDDVQPDDSRNWPNQWRVQAAQINGKFDIVTRTNPREDAVEAQRESVDSVIPGEVVDDDDADDSDSVDGVVDDEEIPDEVADI